MPMAAHTQKTKGKIIEVATQLLLEQGFGAASVVRIRAAARVSNGSFYGAFATRQTLLDHILGTIQASHRPMLMMATSRPAKSGRHVLSGILRAHLQWLAENPALARLRDLLAQGLAAEAPATATPAIAWELELLATWARPLMAEGTIRSLPAPLLHALVLGNADAVARHWNAEGGSGLCGHHGANSGRSGMGGDPRCGPTGTGTRYPPPPRKESSRRRGGQLQSSSHPHETCSRIATRQATMLATIKSEGMAVSTDGDVDRWRRRSRAAEYALTIHAHQRRKGTTTPYISHLLGVASLVLEHGGFRDPSRR